MYYISHVVCVYEFLESFISQNMRLATNWLAINIFNITYYFTDRRNDGFGTNKGKRCHE